MAYRIDPGEPTNVELRRVIAEQLGRAVEVLRVPGGPDPDSVHEVRRRLKKARSAARLGRADLGAAVAKHANAELRRVGADLAQQRDADALVEAVDRLLVANGGEADPTVDALSAVRRLVVDRAEAVRLQGPLQRATVIGAARTLEQTVAWLELVPPHATGWKALGPGLGRQYGRGLQLWQGLPAEPSVEQLHEWRKRVKDLWYHQRLLRRLWTEGQRPVVDAADELAATLGVDRDLGLLLAHVVPGPPDVREGAAPIEPFSVDAQTSQLVGDAGRALRSDLQARARDLGSQLYADSPAAWASRHGKWWDAAARRAETARNPVASDPSLLGTTA